MPRLSVLIPSGRGGPFLRQALDSVLAQDFRDFELLVSDDSRDESVRDVVQAIEDPRLKLLQGPRAGQIANTAFLWDQAQGELVKYVHDDDYLLPGALSAMVEALDETPQAALTFVQRRFLRADGSMSSDNQTFPNKTYGPRSVVNDVLGGAHNPIGEPTCSMFRRSSMDSVGTYAGFPIRFIIDVAMYLNAVARGSLVGVHRYFAVVRLHPEQFSKTSPHRSASTFEWELFIRAELTTGRLSREAALRGMDRLLPFYRSRSHRYADVAAFLPGLEQLRRDVQEDRKREYLDLDYRRAWARASAIIEARANNPAAP